MKNNYFLIKKFRSGLQTLGLSLLLLIIFQSQATAQDYIIERGDITGGGWYNGGMRMCVVDKNEYYQPYLTGASKVAVRQYKNSIISDWGTNTAFPDASGEGDIARDSINQVIYIAFFNSYYSKIYTYKRAVTDNDWVFVNTLDNPDAFDFMGYTLRLAFNKNSGTLFMSFNEQTSLKVYFYELVAGAWTDLTGSSSMSCNNSEFEMVAYGNRVIITTTPMIGSYYTLQVHSYNITTHSFTNLPDWNNGVEYQSVRFATTAYKSATDEYVSFVSSYNGTNYLPKVVKSAGGAAWTDMSNGLPAEDIANGSWDCSIVYNNLTSKYSLIYAKASPALVKGYNWNGTTWINMNVPDMTASNIFATTNYKDVYFLGWDAYTYVDIYSTNETPFRNTMNISTASSTANCVLTFSQRGVGNKVAVFIKSGSYVAPVTANNTTYTANTNFGDGTQLGSSGWYCIYNDVGQDVTVTGLTNNTTYQVQALEYNGVAGAEMYIGTTFVTGNPVSFTTATYTWTGSSTTNWNTSANWNPSSGVPTSADHVFIPVTSNNPVVNQEVGSPAVCNNLTIQSGAVVTIAPAKALTVNGTLTNNAGTGGLVIRSDATGTGSLLHNTADVNATIQRYIPGSATLTNMVYHLVSVPLTPATASTSNLFLGSYLYNFTESTNGWVNMGTSTTNVLDETRGYMVYYPGASQTYSFEGPMNNGSFTALTSFTGGKSTNNPDAGSYGKNLVPNPYPSSIDWDAASGWTKTNISNAVYVWNSAVSISNYASYVSGVSANGGSRYIAPGQAFFVQAISTNPVLTMGYNVRVHNSVSFMKSNEIIPDLLKIHADAASASDEIAVRFADGATASFDGEWDAYKMIGGEDAPQMNTVTADNIDLAINSLPLSAEPVTVPLNFTLNTNSDVTFTASGMESFNPASSIYLEDKVLNKTINLKAEPVYTFSYQNGSANDRFVLHFNGVTGVQDNTAAVSGRAFISNGRIYLEVPSMQGKLASITVYNAIGQVIRSQSQMINGISSIEAPLSAGVYIIHVATASQNFVTKVINK